MLDDRIVSPESRHAGALERILYLKRLPMVGTLPGPALGVVAEHLRERFFPKGSSLLREGEPVAALYLPIEGTIRVTRKGRSLGSAGPGSAVGGIGVLAPDNEGVGAVAETDTLALELPATALIEILEDNFGILHHVLRDVCRQVITLFRRPGVDPPFPPPQASPNVPGRELDLVERIFLVRRYAPFEHASVNALAELSRGLTEARFEPGAVLWREGEPAGWVSLLVTGTVTCVLPGGRRFRAGPGAPLGALESVAECPRWYEPVTETPVVALHGNIQGLLDVFEDNFAMAMDYLAVMARLLAVAHERSVASEEAGPRLFAGTEMPTADAETPA